MNDPHSLRDCGLCTALPLTYDAFAVQWESPNHDFCRSLVSYSKLAPMELAWSNYKNALLPFLGLLEFAENSGILVSTDVTPSQLASMSRSVKIISIFAHSKVLQSAASGYGGFNIELANGFISIESLLESFDASFLDIGILDLAICRSTEGMEVAKKFGTLTVVCNHKSTDLRVRSILQKAAYRVLPNANDYFSAMSLVRRAAK